MRDENDDNVIVLSPIEYVIESSTWDYEWLFRIVVMYLIADLPTEAVEPLCSMEAGQFRDLLVRGMRNHPHPDTMVLMTCLIGASHCNAGASPWNLSWHLERTHVEYREVVRSILRLPGAAIDRSDQESIDMLAQILKPHSTLVNLREDLFMDDIEHILEFFSVYQVVEPTSSSSSSDSKTGDETDDASAQAPGQTSANPGESSAQAPAPAPGQTSANPDNASAQAPGQTSANPSAAPAPPAPPVLSAEEERELQQTILRLAFLQSRQGPR